MTLVRVESRPLKPVIKPTPATANAQPAASKPVVPERIETPKPAPSSPAITVKASNIVACEHPVAPAPAPVITTTAPFGPLLDGLSEFWIGERLLQEGKITTEQLEAAKETHAKKKKATAFSDTLEMLQLVSPQRVAQIIALKYRLPYLAQINAKREVARRVSQGKARSRCMLPFNTDKGEIQIVVADPAIYGREQAELDFQGEKIKLHVSPRKEILAAIEAVWKTPVPVSDPTEYVDRLLLEVITEYGPTDIHFEMKAHSLQIRRRVDGKLSLHENVAEQDRDGVIQALMIKANIEFTKRALPDDGKFEIKHGARVYSCRVSTMPCVYGIKVTVRIAHENQGELSFVALGMTDEHATTMARQIRMPHGAFIHTGPTGSGKTTLQNCSLNSLDLADLNVIEFAEPIETVNPSINQVEINPAVGMTYPIALKHALRQDPDVLAVGEVRDQETAALTIRAALTGHLCFATLHTNDAASAVTRLVDMGIEPFLIASSINAIVAQRLVKKLCANKKCRRVSPHNEQLKKQYGIEDGTIYEANPDGCDECNEGYKGRTGIFEILVVRGNESDPGSAGSTEANLLAPLTPNSGAMSGTEKDDAMRGMILAIGRKDKSEGDLKNLAISFGMKTLRQDGLRLVARGITTLEEVLRETM